MTQAKYTFAPLDTEGSWVRCWHCIVCKKNYRSRALRIRCALLDHEGYDALLWKGYYDSLQRLKKIPT